MMTVAGARRIVAVSRWLAIVIVAVWLVTSLAYFVHGKAFVKAAYQGRSFPAFNNLVEHHRQARPESRGLEYFHRKQTTAFVGLCFGFTVIEGVLLLVAFHGSVVDRVIKRGRTFLLAREYPFNLAFFRIVFFLFLAWYFDGAESLWFHQLPPELQVAPLGFGWALPILASIPPNGIEFLAHLLPLVCLSAAIGFFARSSAFLAAFLGFILLGIPQSFGKIQPTHALVWVALLLAASRSADAFSLDALVRASSSSTVSTDLAKSRSVAYSLPLRLIWLILGVGYFFAGMWKVIDGRWQWVFSDNVRNQVFYLALVKQQLPYVAMNLPRWSFHLGALFTIVFEIAFLGLILFRRGRPVAVLLGLIFHNSVGFLFGGGGFLPLQACYCSLINWYPPIHRRRRGVGRQNVRYDSDCLICRGAVGCAGTLGKLNSVPYRELLSELPTSRVALVNCGVATDLHREHTAGSAVRAYYDVCRSLAGHLPLIWLAYPVLVASHMWHRLSVRRGDAANHCGSRSLRRLPFLNSAGRPYLVGFVGAVIIGTNSVFAIFHSNGWPFTSFPFFTHIMTETYIVFRVERTDAGGNVAALDPTTTPKGLNASKVQAICENIYRHPNSPEIGTASCKVLRNEVLDFDAAVAIRLYAEENSVLPWDRGKNPLTRRLVFECK